MQKIKLQSYNLVTLFNISEYYSSTHYNIMQATSDKYTEDKKYGK
jgi:hypothetical protein